jgi:hypothetical protein
LAQFAKHQLTNNTYQDSYPSIYNDTIAWVSYPTSEPTGIYYWDGSSTTYVADGSSPSLYDGTIAYYSTEDGGSIYYWDGSSSTYVGQGGHPSLYNGTIAYDNGGSIYYWDGSSSTYIGEGGIPSLYNGTIAWQWYDGTDLEILYWNGTATTQITDNDYLDEDASLYNGQIAWSGDVNGQREILFWDNNSVTQVTNNPTDDAYPSLCNGKIAWRRGDAGDTWEIFYWDSSTVMQVTNDEVGDGMPSLHNDTIAWHKYDPNSLEIYYANLIPPEPVSIDIIPKTCPNECSIKGGGSIEVAILGTADFDVTDIDIASVRLGLEGSPGVAPVRSNLKDKSTPASTGGDCPCTTEGRDGFIDLCLKFDKKAIFDALGDEVSVGVRFELILTGSMNDGTPIEGYDCMDIVKKGKKGEKD